MKIVVISFIIFLLFAACRSESGMNSEVKRMSETERSKQYDALKNRIISIKDRFKDSTSTSALDSLADTFHSYMLDSVFEYWYGTPWDFNGVSQKPQHGKIACGYFVSTTLEHVGFKVERIKLAQQASSKIINTLCSNQKIFTNNNYAGVKAHIQKQNDGLFIIGLDNHVAFISKKGDSIFVCHATPPRVIKQKIDDCSAVTKSNYYVIGNLSGNHEILKRWVKNNSIPTKL